MDPENTSRADLALPNPQGPSSAPEIEVLEVSPGDLPQLGTPTAPPPPKTWLTFLKRELQFLGVTQILIGAICLCCGIIVCSVLEMSDFDEEIFSSIKAGYPFWGAVLFAISGLLSIMSEKKNGIHLNLHEDDGCFVASFTTEIVAMMLFLTILGLCSTVSLTIYGIGEEFKRNKIPDDRLYEELNIYSPIYSELEEKIETSSPTSS
ncbi:high affinity immunoglobulin epsilon receptor subunit beta isoform X2 [Ictidomys tridecemlineatus]|nr:membrane spanning 4-domains A2, transcript variant X2 [Ictidomys tridecemlineatus]